MQDRELTITRTYPSSASPPYYRSLGRGGERSAVPFLRLTGRWLAQAGFEIGERVRVEVEHGRLVIEPLER